MKFVTFFNACFQSAMLITHLIVRFSQILISTVSNGSGVSLAQAAAENLPLSATVELRTFTQGKESWEMTLHEKWGWVKSHKEKGGMRFRSGDV